MLLQAFQSLTYGLLAVSAFMLLMAVLYLKEQLRSIERHLKRQAEMTELAQGRLVDKVMNLSDRTWNVEKAVNALRLPAPTVELTVQKPPYRGKKGPRRANARKPNADRRTRQERNRHELL